MMLRKIPAEENWHRYLSENGPIGPQRVPLLEGVALLEKVRQWEAGFEISEVQAKPRVSLPLFLLPAIQM